jgi:hypothetical protein
MPPVEERVKVLGLFQKFENPNKNFRMNRGEGKGKGDNDYLEYMSTTGRLETPKASQARRLLSNTCVLSSFKQSFSYRHE